MTRTTWRESDPSTQAFPHSSNWNERHLYSTSAVRFAATWPTWNGCTDTDVFGRPVRAAVRLERARGSIDVGDGECASAHAVRLAPDVTVCVLRADRKRQRLAVCRRPVDVAHLLDSGVHMSAAHARPLHDPGWIRAGVGRALVGTANGENRQSYGGENACVHLVSVYGRFERVAHATHRRAARPESAGAARRARRPRRRRARR
jgi:hypothetical protein